MNESIPQTQHAVQLIGPDELTFNRAKPVTRPGPHQILCRVEAVGLCFSDLKLLKQFSGHARKSNILSGIDPAILDEIPSYVPGNKPTVPGHESVVRVVAVGKAVPDFKAGERFLVQTDYRWLPTDNSNASYGYNFEGSLQEYVLMDERIITSPTGDSMLIPVGDDLSASAVALIEPWACVEDAYACRERGTIKSNGRMLVVAEANCKLDSFNALLERYGEPGRITWVSRQAPPDGLDMPVETNPDIATLPDVTFDDVIYYGGQAETAEMLFSKVAAGGLFNVVLGGGKFGRTITTPIGRVHYGGIRLIGTIGADPADAMAYIPASGEIRPSDKINVIGAAGPMGLMHVVRNICQGVADITVWAGDVSDERLALLNRIAAPLAQKNNVAYLAYNPTEKIPEQAFDYVALMAPVPALAAESVVNAAPGAIINLFAGIPATVAGEIDLDAYIEKQLYFIGTSGSVLDDMKRVLQKVEQAQLDTNLSVAAVSGLDGAVEGIRAVENHLVAGKIVVYPACKGLGLTTLEELAENSSGFAELLRGGLWNIEAERKLLEQYG